ncbi:hypothetical protein PSUB009319_30130 [Ralstonia sp. SET104]|nr:hypothetical protein PSUB009319_30130 [Ralstonia sp. SET104]
MGGADLRADLLVEVAAVAQAGQRIVHGGLLQQHVRLERAPVQRRDFPYQHTVKRPVLSRLRVVSVRQAGAASVPTSQAPVSGGKSLGSDRGAATAGLSLVA